MKIENILENINIPSEKIQEISKKPRIVENIIKIMENTKNFTKLHYSLACTVPKNYDLKMLTELIDNGVIHHEGILRSVYNYLKHSPREKIEDFILRNDYTREEIEKFIEAKFPISKVELLKEIKKEMPYVDFKIVLEIIESKAYFLNKNINSVQEKKNKKKLENINTHSTNDIIYNSIIDKNSEYKWLDEGLVSMLKTPQENTYNKESILEAHLKRTEGKVITRFPPEPNGRLHIGHIKAINLNFLYAKKYNGLTYLRFDDTNPKNESEEFYKLIIEDIEWLGFHPDRITASSDYNDKMNNCLRDLIKSGQAYCCHCLIDDIRIRRQLFQKERDSGIYDPTILSPYRNRKISENLFIFEQMIRGEIREGKAVVRFKMDLSSRNPLMLDLVAARIFDIIHPIKKCNFYLYPTYEFALCFSDSEEDITHSFCSREFKTRQEPYHWVLNNLSRYEPVQWEFSKLVLSNSILSKRNMKFLVETHGFEWDDPRLYTICGMRRRGFPSDAINKFVRSLGITYSETVVDVKILENYVRNELHATSKKIFCVKNPLELKISNLTKREICLIEGEESILVNKSIFIDRADFSEISITDFHRLTPTQSVGLLGIGCIRFTGFINKVVICELCDEKPKKYIHWISDLSNKVLLNIYKPLFNSFSYSNNNYMKDINLDSLEKLEAYCDKRIKGAKPLDRFQFIRMGFFCCDRTTYEGNLVFNLTLSLKNLH